VTSPGAALRAGFVAAAAQKKVPEVDIMRVTGHAQRLGDRGEFALDDLHPGSPTVFIALRDVHAVNAAVLDEPAMQRALHGENKPICVLIFTPNPATGSATGPLAAFMLDHELVSSPDPTGFFSEQSSKMGRLNILHAHVDGVSGRRRIEVGGKVASFATGTIRLATK
jgi:predicted PhzF superfamily epimerase YddE/YHI9